MYPIFHSTRCANRTIRALNKLACIALPLMLFATATYCQSVTEVITDYNGYWKSGSSAISAVKPDKSHNLLSFTYNGTRYSTGVNDSILTAKGNTFTTGEFKALPVSQLTGAVNGNTKIGLGQLYDGVNNGAGTPRPENNLAKYLTDGIRGLDLGTCVANLPAGDLFFPINNLHASAIGDGIPDLLITQVADPSTSSLDKYAFADINGNTIGNSVDIVLNNLPVVGNWTADFYEASSNSMQLAAGFTNTDRPLRLWAADFSMFGINSSNISQIAYFKIRLNGNSDVAFVAYNSKTVTVLTSPLPVTLGWFKGSVEQQQVRLKWQTQTEINSDRFVIESSMDGADFFAIDSVDAAGMSYNPVNYSYTQQQVKAGKWFYRLKQVDKNGRFTYSSVVTITYNPAGSTSFIVYPNPTTDRVYINYNRASGSEHYRVLTMQGNVLSEKQVIAGSVQTMLDIKNMPAGTYILVWNDGVEKRTKTIIKQ